MAANQKRESNIIGLGRFNFRVFRIQFASKFAKRLLTAGYLGGLSLATLSLFGFIDL